MNVNGHFIELQLDASGDASFERKLLGRCWHFLHSVSKALSLSYQVDFPDWQPVRFERGAVKDSGTFGSRIRVFACASTLQQILTELEDNSLCLSGCVTTSPVQPVPESSQFVTCIRSRAMEKTTPGYKQRQARRDAKRIAEGKWAPKATEASAVHAAGLLQERRPNFVTLASLREDGASFHYRLSVERRDAPGPRESGSSFGLGGAVPMF